MKQTYSNEVEDLVQLEQNMLDMIEEDPDNSMQKIANTLNAKSLENS